MEEWGVRHILLCKVEACGGKGKSSFQKPITCVSRNNTLPPLLWQEGQKVMVGVGLKSSSSSLGVFYDLEMGLFSPYFKDLGATDACSFVLVCRQWHIIFMLRYWRKALRLTHMRMLLHVLENLSAIWKRDKDSACILTTLILLQGLSKMPLYKPYIIALVLNPAL